MDEKTHAMLQHSGCKSPQNNEKINFEHMI